MEELNTGAGGNNHHERTSLYVFSTVPPSVKVPYCARNVAGYGRKEALFR
jgi:hypothetical protein